MNCFLWFHNWDKWSEPYDETVSEKILGAYDFRTGKSIYNEYSEDRQKRKCIKCGKVQVRAI